MVKSCYTGRWEYALRLGTNKVVIRSFFVANLFVGGELARGRSGAGDVAAGGL